MTGSPVQRRTRICGGVSALTVSVNFIGAYAQLETVAVASQPDGIAYAKPSTTGGGYSAADSSC